MSKFLDWEVLCNTDIFGHDLGVTPGHTGAVSNIRECAENCADTRLCLAFTFACGHTNDTGEFNCWLKGTATAHDNMRYTGKRDDCCIELVTVLKPTSGSLASTPKQSLTTHIDEAGVSHSVGVVNAGGIPVPEVPAVTGQAVTNYTSSADSPYKLPIVITVAASVLLRVFVLRAVEMFRPDWYVSKDRLVYNQYVRRVFWELAVYFLAIATSFAALGLYIKSQDMQAGIIFVVAIAEILLKTLASAFYAVHIIRAARAFYRFRDVWNTGAHPVGLPLAVPAAWEHKSKQHVQLNNMLLPVHDANDISLQYEDWNKMMPCIAQARPIRQAWTCVLAAYAILQAGATKALSHAWGHSIVIPRILAYDIYCQATWAWRDSRLRYYEPGHVTGEVDRVPGAAANPRQKWLVEDTELYQLTVLEHTALYLLAWDVYTVFVLTYLPLQLWRDIFDNPAVDQSLVGMHEQLRTCDAFGMDACGYAAVTGALAFAKCIRDPTRQGLDHHEPWHEPDKRQAVQLAATAMMLELYSQMHNIDATAHISYCESMVAAARAWAAQRHIPFAADDARLALVNGRCRQCRTTLQRIQQRLELEANYLPDAVFQ
jgi:hypothetical protein